MAEKERKGGCLTGVAWMAKAARVNSKVVVDAMEPDDPLTMVTATQQGCNTRFFWQTIKFCRISSAF
jgi:hypothetical protein